MSDIVERLRVDRIRYTSLTDIEAQNLRMEAADEIERLREAIECWYENASPDSCNTLETIAEENRK